ncbi:CGNR zinc finger domain-containing protein [Nocardiopsis algeriensis]|uniref:Putative RNA-binding Zn ribbon-like protein n=1 Tax=Nocardiopsis algeriensis TaxID=1478215 RepID=A0A841IP17_9ACTN|nr:CGNR zinc finger domain-containing protein [Nocardiopsis algeriensis]MBB6119930.1 putative RNA-binding Zn ribbon-like protein [Nocardiopsis algeriensis]
MERHLALELADTIHRGDAAGVTDELSTPESTARWLDTVGGPLPAAGRVDEALHAQVVVLRGAVRSLLARAAGPADPAGGAAAPDPQEALSLLNAASAREPVVPRLRWTEGDVPTVEMAPAEGCADTVAALARSAMAFLDSPDRERLRSCSAPGCLRYFVQAHGRQQWCATACGNRARAARHYRRHAGARA